MPETTGETENGRSISVMRNALPRNSYLATHQAAATPKTRLSGTAMAATISVSRIAGLRSRIGERLEIGLDALAEGLDEDEDQRQHQDQQHEDDGDADQRPAHPAAARWSARMCVGRLVGRRLS